MNRELKFRVWDSDKKQYEYFELHNITVPDQLLCQHKYPVQQFTGLKDLKGKNLYEKDTIKFLHKEKYVKSEVVYASRFGMFAVVLEPNEENEILTYKSLYDVGEFEIIGNFVD